MFVQKKSGHGAPLFMLHGWGKSHKDLLPLSELLLPSCNPFLFDLPGFGQSPMPDGVWSADDYAERLVRFADENGIKTFSLLGHSFGGKVALSIAAGYPERVQKLALLAPSGILPKKTLKEKIRRQAVRSAGKLIKWVDGKAKTQFFQNAFVPRFGSNDYKNAGGMRPILVRSVTEDISLKLPNIRCAVCLLWGGRDTETPLEIGHRMARLIPKARLHTFWQHGHFLHHDCGAHLAAFYLRSFLKEAGQC